MGGEGFKVDEIFEDAQKEEAGWLSEEDKAAT
jgi:hypothetical protein